MKHFLKRANRGLLLAAAAVIALVIYTAADYAAFQTQKDDIRNTVTAYYDEILKTNEDERGISKEHYADVTKLIDKYWSDADSSLQATLKSDMMSLSSSLFTGEGYTLDITKAGAIITGIKIQKSAPGYAIATLSYSVSITGAASSYALTPSNFRMLDESAVPNDSAQPGAKPETGTLSYDVRNAQVELHKEKDGWKICAINAFTDNTEFKKDV